MTDRGPAAARFARQLLHRPGGRDVAETVRHLVALQAQDVSAYPLALRARMPELAAADVVAALQAKSVVRTWGPRGTIHLIAAEDLRWLLPLVRPSAAASVRRLAQLGAAQSAEDAVAAAERALRGAGPLTKAELGERLRSGTGNAAIDGQAIVHMAMLAARAGRAVLGPERAGKPTYVHAADWLGAPVDMAVDPDRALPELVARYLDSHAPAGPDDLAAWSGIPVGRLRPHFPNVADLAAPGAGDGDLPVRLLPAFDEYLLGWRGRAWAVPDELAKAAHPGGGVVRAVALVDGRVAGVWRRGRAGIVLEPGIGSVQVAAEKAEVEAFLNATGR